MVIRKSLAILTVITALFTVACETDEDPGTDVGGDLGATTLPGGDLGTDTTQPMTETTVGG